MDLSFVLLDELFKLYSLEEKYGNTLKLYKYLVIRCGLALDNKKWTKEDFAIFILSELNIQIFKDEKSPYVEYYNEISTVYSVGSSFLENLEFRASIEGELDYKKLMSDVYNKGYKKSKKYKKLDGYKNHIKYNRLIALNNELGVTPKSSMGVDGFKKDLSHNPFKRSIEERLESEIKAEKFVGTKTTTYITENDLESYLIKNLSLFEEGLAFMGRQIEVEGGIVDILARDKDRNLVVIELKIEESKSIVWQAIHYPKEIMKKHQTKNVRMITLAPNYSDGLLSTLKSLEHVEIYDYNIIVKDKIVDLSLNRC